MPSSEGQGVRDLRERTQSQGKRKRKQGNEGVRVRIPVCEDKGKCDISFILNLRPRGNRSKMGIVSLQRDGGGGGGV